MSAYDRRDAEMARLDSVIVLLRDEIARLDSVIVLSRDEIARLVAERGRLARAVEAALTELHIARDVTNGAVVRKRIRAAIAEHLT